jgi:hypothetical protein
MNTAVYPRKELTFELTGKKVNSLGTMTVSYIVFMNTSYLDSPEVECAGRREEMREREINPLNYGSPAVHKPSRKT